MKLEENSNSPSSSACKHDRHKSISVSYDITLDMLKSQPGARKFRYRLVNKVVVAPTKRKRLSRGRHCRFWIQQIRFELVNCVVLVVHTEPLGASACASMLDKLITCLLTVAQPPTKRLMTESRILIWLRGMHRDLYIPTVLL